MTHYCSMEYKTAYLSGEFGEKFALRHFSPETVESMGRYSKGKRKGQLKGSIVWEKCVKGGWHRTGRGYEGERSEGFVMFPGMFRIALVQQEWGSSEEKVVVEKFLQGPRKGA